MASEKIVELTDDNFDQEVYESDKPVLVDFWADWCMPCRALAPTIDELAEDFDGKVKVAKFDTSASQGVPMKLDIQAIPTVILFKNGEIARKFVGLTKKQEFASELEKLTNS